MLKASVQHLDLDPTENTWIIYRPSPTARLLPIVKMWPESILTSFQNKTLFPIRVCDQTGAEDRRRLHNSPWVWTFGVQIEPFLPSLLLPLWTLACLQTRPISSCQTDGQTDPGLQRRPRQIQREDEEIRRQEYIWNRRFLWNLKRNLIKMCQSVRSGGGGGAAEAVIKV